MPSILANFASTWRADKARADLEALGVEAVSVKSIAQEGGATDRGGRTPTMKWGRFGYTEQANIVDALASVDPLTQEGPKNVLLTAVLSDALIDQAVTVIKRWGGSV